MTADRIDRDHIQECAQHQISDGRMAAVYEGLSDKDRMALARMTADTRRDDDTTRWSRPPDEL
jgi:hypothetical protein